MATVICFKTNWTVITELLSLIRLPVGRPPPTDLTARRHLKLSHDGRYFARKMAASAGWLFLHLVGDSGRGSLGFGGSTVSGGGAGRG